jgi:hypothetical protein
MLLKSCAMPPVSWPDRLHLLDLAELRLGRGALGRFGAQALVGLAQLAGALATACSSAMARLASLSASARARSAAR